MIERPNPEELLAGPLGQWLAEQDGARARARERASWWVTAGIIGACLVAAVVILFSHGGIGLALQLGFFTGIGGFGIGELIKRPVVNQIKTGINGAIARALGLQYSLSLQPGAAFKQAVAFELVPGHDDADFEDLWWGELGAQSFTLHEAKLTEQRGSGKNRRTVTVFEGTLMQIGFARKFIGTTLIEKNNQRRKFLFGGEKDSITLNGVTLNRIDMVDPAFEDRFTIWSDDGVEARYLVHPEYVERLTAVESAFAGENLRALFCDGTLLVVLETGNMFESGSLDSGEDRQRLTQAITQFSSMADLASRLNERPRAGFN